MDGERIFLFVPKVFVTLQFNVKNGHIIIYHNPDLIYEKIYSYHTT